MQVLDGRITTVHQHVKRSGVTTKAPKEEVSEAENIRALIKFLNLK